MLRVAEGFLASVGHDTSIEDDEEMPIPVTCCDRHNAQWRDAAPTTGTIKSIRKSTGGDGAQSGIDDRANVSAETSRRLACDASVVHWLENHKGEPLSIGRKSRSIPPSIRRALQRRDHGCRFPGCTCVHYVDAHHIKHWADGGETRMENLALLCRKHHRFVHEEGFGVHPKANGRIDFTDPKGQTIPVTADGRFRGNVGSLTDENSQNGVEITAETGKCWWGGEGMDDNHAMTCMLQLE